MPNRRYAVERTFRMADRSQAPWAALVTLDKLVDAQKVARAMAQTGMRVRLVNTATGEVLEGVNR